MRASKRFRLSCIFAACALLLAPLATAAAAEKIDGMFTASDGVKIHFIEMGQGTPVILIHGYTGSAESNWFANGVAEALARNHRVVAIDCRNHGKSDKPQPDGPGKAEDVVEMMVYLKIPKAHFHGYSMGGAIVARLLTMIPDRMITAGFGGSGIREVDPAWLAKLPPDKDGRDPQEAEVSQRLRIRHAMDNGLTREEAEKLASTPPAPRPTADVVAAALRNTPQIDLTKLNIPMLVINGEFDKPNAKSARIAREVKNAKIVVLPGKSHLTAIAAGYLPKEYIDSTVAFIDANDPK
jgi:pimeloyl-ACP methyl ester carboxylesterase